MKKLLKITIIIIAILMTNCAIFDYDYPISNFELFDTVLEVSDDPTYGYTPENPVTIKNGDLGSSINSSYYFLSRLRTENGNKFQLLMRACRENPNYKELTFPIKDLYTGRQLNYGNGPLIDMYLLKAENENDTIRIFINPYLQGDIKVPYGLKFEYNKIYNK